MRVIILFPLMVLHYLYKHFLTFAPIWKFGQSREVIESLFTTKDKVVKPESTGFVGNQLPDDFHLHISLHEKAKILMEYGRIYEADEIFKNISVSPPKSIFDIDKEKHVALMKSLIVDYPGIQKNENTR